MSSLSSLSIVSLRSMATTKYRLNSLRDAMAVRVLSNGIAKTVYGERTVGNTADLKYFSCLLAGECRGMI